jgi:iron complex outermembrane receptor protein
MHVPYPRTGCAFLRQLPRILLGASVLALLGPVATVRTAEPSADVAALRDLSLKEIMEIKIPTVYGASKHEQKITDAPSSVSIVPRAEIQAFGHRTLADVLRSVRDFYVTDDRNYGYIGVRGFNRPGDYGGRILLLVDGHRVSDPIYNTVGVMQDFPVDLDMIERVEVIRGPGSSLYGNNAFFAVINVVTRSARDVGGLELSGEAGSHETYKGRLTFGHTFKSGLSLLLTGSGFDSTGEERLFFREYDEPETNRGIAERLDAEWAKKASATVTYKEFTLQAVYSERTKEVPTGSYGTLFNNSQSYTEDANAFVRLGYARDFASDLNVQGNVSWNYYDYSGDYPYAGIGEEVSIYRDQASAQWWRGEFQISRQFWKTHRVTAGAEVQLNTGLEIAAFYVGASSDALRIHSATDTYGVFLQDEWAITSQLELNVGARYDILDSFGSTVNPRGALVYHPSKETAVKLLYGHAFRAPNLYESNYANSSTAYRPNPDLRPEAIRSYEAVLEQNISRALRLSASVFYNQVEDLISEGLDEATGDLFFANLESAETKGASLELEVKLPIGLSTRASYTFQNTIDEATDTRLSNSPQHLAKLNLLLPIYRDKVTGGLEVQYSSAVQNARGRTTDGFVVANWTFFSRNLIKNLEVSASVYNLFDAKYGYPGGPEHLQDSIEQNGRTFRLKVTHRF